MNIAQIRKIIRESSRTVLSLNEHSGRLRTVGNALVATLKAGGKVLTAGNGGSAAAALHMAEELVGRFRHNRRSLAGIALTADCTALTCIGNDFGFDEIFSRQVEGIGREGDALVLFSTSGRAANLSRALEAAKARGVKTVCILGRDGGAMAAKGDHEIIIRSQATERIQEAHDVVIHILLETIEQAFSRDGARK